MDSANGDSGGAGEQTGAAKDVCRDFLRKACNRGSSCKYLHPADAVKKLEFCHDFQNSICSRRNCKFVHCSHEDEEYYLANGRLPPGVDEFGNRGASTPSKQEVALCRDFMNGKCTRGAKCKFRHQSQGDLEYERMRSMRGARGSFGAYDDDDGFGRGRLGMIDAYRAMSRYGRPGAYDRPAGYLDFEDGSQSRLEDENTRLRQKVELMRKQIDDLTSTNEVLLQQNAQLRTGISVAQV